MEKSLKEVVDKITKIKGHVRGDVILGTISCIRRKEGEEGLNLLIKKWMNWVIF